MAKYISALESRSIRRVTRSSDILDELVSNTPAEWGGRLSNEELLKRAISEFERYSFLDNLGLLPKGKAPYADLVGGAARAVEIAAKRLAVQSPWGQIAALALQEVRKWKRERDATRPMVAYAWGPPADWTSQYPWGTNCLATGWQVTWETWQAGGNYVCALAYEDAAVGNPVTETSEHVRNWKGYDERLVPSYPRYCTMGNAWTSPYPASDPRFKPFVIPGSSVMPAQWMKRPAPQRRAVQAAVAAGQQVSSAAEPAPKPAPAPAEMPAIVVVPGTAGGSFEPPTHRFEPPPKGTREKKMRLHLHPASIAMKIVSGITNGAEIVDCLYKALPASAIKEFKRSEYKSGRHWKGWKPAPQDKARAVYRYIKLVDAGRFAQCVVANEIEDRVYAAPGRGLRGLYSAGNYHHGIETGGGLSGGPDNARPDVSGAVGDFLDWLGSFGG